MGGGVATGATVAKVNKDYVTLKTKEELKELVLQLEKREETVKNNIIKYIQLTGEAMNDKDQEIEKIKSENKALILQLNTANSKAKAIEEKLTEKEKESEKKEKTQRQKEKPPSSKIPSSGDP